MIIKRLIKEFKELSWINKVVVIGASYFIYLYCSAFPKIYFDQNTPCVVANEFIKLPLPPRDSIVIEPLDSNKMLIFSLNMTVRDSDKKYENEFRKYFFESGYREKTNTLYTKGDLEIDVQRIDKQLIVTLRKQMKGEFSHVE